MLDLIQKYQYKVITITSLRTAEEEFNKLGQKGWKLFSIKRGICVFIRPFMNKKKGEVITINDETDLVEAAEKGEELYTAEEI